MNTKNHTVTFLNPRTCGIYKSGGIRYKTDPDTGKRTQEIDNELIEAVNAYVDGKPCDCRFDVEEPDVFANTVIVPTYYDDRYNRPIKETLKQLGATGITLGDLLDAKTISVRGGHGSPGNDQRAGHIPYIKVSDIRAMRMNINPTNLVSAKVAERYWRGKASGLRAWDVLTPNRASSNIGEFAIIVPGEEQVVLTKEMFLFRVIDSSVWDPFYLFWALCLSAVREQWRRVALLQPFFERRSDPLRIAAIARAAEGFVSQAFSFERVGGVSGNFAPPATPCGNAPTAYCGYECGNEPTVERHRGWDPRQLRRWDHVGWWTR